MKFVTSRFGEIEFDEPRVIRFAEGMLGFANFTRYILIEPQDGAMFKWLQSVENGDLAFVLVDPLQVVADYRAEVSKEDIATLELKSLEHVVVLCITNIAKGCETVTVNLVGPIIINAENLLAKQVILQDTSYDVRHVIFTKDDLQHKSGTGQV